MSDETSEPLTGELVDVYETYVVARTQQYGVDLASALTDGRAWLEAELKTEMAKPYNEQRRGPLEIFQASMSFPNEALAAAGAAEPTRDALTINALPGDRFDLAPASSRDISEAAWEAHLAWGVTKAAAFKGLADSEGS